MKILITGGASGLGEAITVKLAQNLEDFVYFTYNNSSEKALNIEVTYKNTKSIKCDFTNKLEFELFLEQLKDLDIDVLINNAFNGPFLTTYFHKIESKDFLKDFNNNIIPLIDLTKTAINIFRKKKKGKIITILSAALVDVPPTGSSIYVANKAYIQQLSKVWASENIKFNITSNTVSPSLMKTSLTSDMDKRLIEQFENNHPLKKVLPLSEVADAVNYLTTASTYINGIDLLINAGTNIK